MKVSTILIITSIIPPLVGSLAILSMSVKFLIIIFAGTLRSSVMPIPIAPTTNPIIPMLPANINYGTIKKFYYSI